MSNQKITVLHPWQIEAGDDVRASSGSVDITGRAASVEIAEATEAGTLVMLDAGNGERVALRGDSWTLTATREVPEIEAGVRGRATVRGVGDGVRVYRIDHSARGERGWVAATEFPAYRFGVVFEDDEVTDFVPDEPRPLPTRDDLADLLEDVFGGNSYATVADAVLGLLRGESR